MVSCNWRYGEGPCGKSYAVLEKKDNKVFTFVDENDLFKNYDDQNTLLINYDEIEMPLMNLLSLIDFNKEKGRYRQKTDKCKTINITNIEIISNRHPQNVFKDAHKSTYNALLRRITIVWHYIKDDKYIQEQVS
ncbi:MAG: hypothetical protein CMB64_05275 [Euryarchaeota archaeon]|nr:hypothetical protein [Euryarchaeota archaeon]|tara:strand:- start:2796 stop:3197 length:402 start_codon:yes stop_codon:yes gene_type:complete